MGCTFTKNGPNDSTGKGKNKNKGKNRELEGIMDIPPPAPVDPRLPLNARQKFSIGKSWKGIARAMEPTGINMFIRLFEEHTELIELFTKLRELRTKESQEDSIELKEHATKVMQTLDESIQSLDNLDYFFDYLHQVGSLHLKIPGFKKEYFWKIEKPFLCAVKETLGDRYTENIENIYTITIHFILEQLIKGYENAEKSATVPPN